MNDFSQLAGSKIITIDGAVAGSERCTIVFLKAGKLFRMLLNHVQDCCETVSIVDVDGIPADLHGAEVLTAEETTNELERAECGDFTQTWTFYRMLTSAGGFVIRWCGESNGYYSEDVSVTVEPVS